MARSRLGNRERNIAFCMAGLDFSKVQLPPKRGFGQETVITKISFERSVDRLSTCAAEIQIRRNIFPRTRDLRVFSRHRNRPRPNSHPCRYQVSTSGQMTFPRIGQYLQGAARQRQSAAEIAEDHIRLLRNLKIGGIPVDKRHPIIQSIVSSQSFRHLHDRIRLDRVNVFCSQLGRRQGEMSRPRADVHHHALRPDQAPQRLDERIGPAAIAPLPAVYHHAIRIEIVRTAHRFGKL